MSKKYFVGWDYCGPIDILYFLWFSFLVFFRVSNYQNCEQSRLVIARAMEQSWREVWEFQISLIIILIIEQRTIKRQIFSFMEKIGFLRAFLCVWNCGKIFLPSAPFEGAMKKCSQRKSHLFFNFLSCFLHLTREWNFLQHRTKTFPLVSDAKMEKLSRVLEKFHSVDEN